MHFNFNKYAQEANTFLNKLAEALNHPEERDRVEIVLRAVLHSIRNRISVEENLDVIAQLPMFLKAIYVEQWHYYGEPQKISHLKDFIDAVKEEQARFGEQKFDWNISTEEMARRTIFLLTTEYFSMGQVAHIKNMFPQEMEVLFE